MGKRGRPKGKIIQFPAPAVDRHTAKVVTVAALAYYRMKGCPMGIGTVRDEEYRLIGYPLRRSTSPDMCQHWRSIVARVHETLLNDLGAA